MAEKSPLVFVDGGFSQLPPGDSIDGLAFGSLAAGSGLVGGGDLSTGSKRLDVGLTTSPSGLIFVGDALGLDGVDQATATTALASGNAGLTQAVAALASGVVAQGAAATALASGNAALNAAVNFQGSSSLTFTAASAIRAGYAVGLDGVGRVQAIREEATENLSFPSPPVVFGPTSTSSFSETLVSTYDSTNNRVVIAYSADGTTSFGTAIVGTVSGTSISFGTAVVFESAVTNSIAITYDSVNNRVVIAYRDAGNSNYGTAVVGTVSGTSISFGTAVVFEAASTNHISTTYDSINNRVVITYRDSGNSDYGTAIVGTVSGTSISFGTAVVFESAGVNSTSATYDSTNNRVVISYANQGNSNYGTAIVGTVSGTSISFGTAVVFRAASTSPIRAVYNSTNNRIVISSYSGVSNSGTSIVGTVSGTSISFGTAVTFAPNGAANISSTYDSTSNRIVVAYRDFNNSDYGTSIIGTVSGTSISFGTAVVFASAVTQYISNTYNSTNNRVVISYQNFSNSSRGTSIVANALISSSVVPTISSQNNFIGIAQSTVASGTSVSVLLPDAVDFNQTGLSPGYFYYVNPTTSGFTTASGQPTTWSGAYNWAPVAKSVSSSGLLLLNPL